MFVNEPIFVGDLIESITVSNRRAYHRSIDPYGHMMSWSCTEDAIDMKLFNKVTPYAFITKNQSSRILTKAQKYDGFWAGHTSIQKGYILIVVGRPITHFQICPIGPKGVAPALLAPETENLQTLS